MLNRLKPWFWTTCQSKTTTKQTVSTFQQHATKTTTHNKVFTATFPSSVSWWPFLTRSCTIFSEFRLSRLLKLSILMKQNWQLVHDVDHEHEAMESLSVHLNKQVASVTVTKSHLDSICVENPKFVTKTVHSTHKHECQDAEDELEKVMSKLDEKRLHNRLWPRHVYNCSCTMQQMPSFCIFIKLIFCCFM